MPIDAGSGTTPPRKTAIPHNALNALQEQASQLEQAASAPVSARTRTDLDTIHREAVDTAKQEKIIHAGGHLDWNLLGDLGKFKAKVQAAFAIAGDSGSAHEAINDSLLHARSLDDVLAVTRNPDVRKYFEQETRDSLKTLAETSTGPRAGWYRTALASLDQPAANG